MADTLNWLMRHRLNLVRELETIRLRYEVPEIGVEAKKHWSRYDLGYAAALKRAIELIDFDIKASGDGKYVQKLADKTPIRESKNEIERR
jgi:hypothetical protein